MVKCDTFLISFGGILLFLFSIFHIDFLTTTSPTLANFEISYSNSYDWNLNDRSPYDCFFNANKLPLCTALSESNVLEISSSGFCCYPFQEPIHTAYLFKNSSQATIEIYSKIQDENNLRSVLKTLNSEQECNFYNAKEQCNLQANLNCLNSSTLTRQVEICLQRYIDVNMVKFSTIYCSTGASIGIGYCHTNPQIDILRTTLFFMMLILSIILCFRSCLKIS